MSLINNPVALGGGGPMAPGGSTPVGTSGITVTQVAYGDTTANTIKGDAAFTFTQGTGVLKIGVTGSSANSISITGDTNGAVSIAAAGTNQNITLTPSGTGNVVFSIPSATDGATLSATRNSVTVGFGTANARGGIGTNTNHPLYFYTNAGSPQVVLTTSSHVLLGGLTTDGTGVLQFPAATTSAGGSTYGDINFFRSGSQFMSFNATSGTQMGCDFYVGGSRKAYFYWTGSDFELAGLGGTTIIKSNNALALTLDSSQNTTFAGKVAVNGATVSTSTALILTASTTGVSSMRVPSGVAPTSPVSGDLWYDGTNLKFRDGSTTRTITWT